MQLRVVVDENVPAWFASVLRHLGCQAWSGADIGLVSAADAAVVAFAATEGAIVLTRDRGPEMVRQLSRQRVASMVLPRKGDALELLTVLLLRLKDVERAKMKPGRRAVLTRRACVVA